jgi:tRNA nucleotidyltransferase/poly(A) polymerase
MDILQKFESDNLYIINVLKKIALSLNINIYLVGGAVRDALLNVPLNDLDFCLDCDPKDILKLLPFHDYSYNEEFKTAKVKYKNTIIDLIYIRKEHYTRSGSLPKVEKGNLYEDLYRRDFTINALAYDIKNQNIMDFFSGLDDLKNKKIKKVHEGSFSEDGTRIFRAVKYKVRYGFLYEDEEEIKKEIKTGFLSLLSNDRIIKEVLLLLKEENWPDAIIELSNLNIMGIDKTKLKKNHYQFDLKNYDDRLLKLILCISDKKYLQYFIENSIINKKLRTAILNFAENKLLNNLIASESNYEIYSILNKLTSYDFKLLMSENITMYKVINYIKNLSSVTPSISGQELASGGYKGKKIGEIIENNLRFRLNTLV